MSSKTRSAYRIPQHCLIRIRGIYHTLGAAERNAVDYFMTAPEEVADSNIVDLAQKAGCSEATLVRISRKLGYNGFPDLKADFAKVEPRSLYTGIHTNDGPLDVARKIFKATQEAIEDTLLVVDENSYLQALDALLEAEKIGFIGIGGSSAVVEDAYQKFLKIGVYCFSSADPDLQVVFASTQLNKGDVLFAISHSGESLPILNAVRLAKERGITIIAITNFPRSSLTKIADIILLTAVFQEHLHGELVAKRVAQLCLLEGLYVNYLMQKGLPVQEKHDTSYMSMRINKT